MAAPRLDKFRHNITEPFIIRLTNGAPVMVLFPGTYEFERDQGGHPNWFMVYGIDANGKREPERLARIALEEDSAGTITVTA